MKTTWQQYLADLKALGMSFRDIAQETGTSAGTIGSIVAGKSKSPRVDLALAIKALHGRKTAAAKRAQQRQAQGEQHAHAD